MDGSIACEPAEHGCGLGAGGGGGSAGAGGRAGRICGARAGFAVPRSMAALARRVGGLVFVAEGVGDLEGFELGDAVAGLLPERFEVGRVDFVVALDLLDHELGV